MERSTQKTSDKTSEKRLIRWVEGREVGLSQEIGHLNCEGQQNLRESSVVKCLTVK